MQKLRTQNPRSLLDENLMMYRGSMINKKKKLVKGLQRIFQSLAKNYPLYELHNILPYNVVLDLSNSDLSDQTDQSNLEEAKSCA